MDSLLLGYSVCGMGAGDRGARQQTADPFVGIRRESSSFHTQEVSFHFID